MTRKIVEASLILSLSAAITTLVMAVIFPVHALGGASRTVDPVHIRPAVFVEVIDDIPVATGDPIRCPFVSQQTWSPRCPYLSALAASSGGPSPSRRGARSACPYLSRQDRSLSETRIPPIGPAARDI